MNRIVWFALLLIPVVAFEWHDWDKRQVCDPVAYVQPSSETEILEVLREAREKHLTVKVVGAGHSFSPIPLTDGIMINLDNYNKVLSTTKASVTVQAGIRVHQLNSALEAEGLALRNVGAICQQSIAGATATSTHGTGNTGSMSSQIIGLRLILANGTIITASQTHNTDLLNAASVGLGALGVISEVTLSVVPLFRLERITQSWKLDDLIPQLPNLTKTYERLQWYWTPYTQDATLLLRVPTTKPITGCWNGSLSTDSENIYGPTSSCVDVSYKALCHQTDDLTLYTEMEYFVNVSHAANLVADFRTFQASVEDRHDPSVSLFTGIRYVKADDIWLSPMYKQDIAVLSMIVLGTPTETGSPAEFSMYGHGLEEIATTKYHGRPHWGKMNWATYTDIAPCYPRLNDFVSIKKQLDPDNMFMNAYLQRMLFPKQKR
eukprot:m.77002 g.77002  ORF g.77002 m.77002 type:complete len:434 (+) comp20646_c0_seq1:93-1394(+)